MQQDFSNSVLAQLVFVLFDFIKLLRLSHFDYLLRRCKECCEALEANTGELGDVEQLMNNLQVMFFTVSFALL